MTNLEVVGDPAQLVLADFEISYVDAGCSEQRVSLTDGWALRLEDCLPVRGFASYKGQRNHVGRWWTATAGAHVAYESWLERDWLVRLDFDADVVGGIAAQPFGCGGPRRRAGRARMRRTISCAAPRVRAYHTARAGHTHCAGQRRTQNSAAWFGINRRAGNVILHHRHIRPVLIRDWSPRLDGINAAIWASRTTTDLTHRT